MLLVMDVGNTNTVLGVYAGDEIVARWRLTTERDRTIDEYGILCRNLFTLAKLDFTAIKAIAISSVVPTLNFTLYKMAITYFEIEPLFVEPEKNSGIKIHYDTPQAVGADRVVNAVAAFHKYGGPCIVVDFGTATTFDAISPAGDYLGGVITPGVQISSEALFLRASRLPRVQIRHPEKVVGTSTIMSIQSGLYFGYIGLVDGILTRMIDELGPQKTVIATGGLAPLIGKGSAIIEIIDDDLLLEGLKLIYERNQS
ncbi:MAG: type III pantothenate kinase [Blastocatellia bacterium]|nr:type III pantothenate kinase [Blastocatellia bacterium]MBL8194396.1 type III pantothenate kinase [Blastocatellia bacterium]